MGGTYYSRRNSYEQTHKKYVVNSCNYLLDHTGNPFGYKNKSAYQEGNEEGDKEASCLGEVAMIEFDPKKVINKDTFVHCRTKEQAASFVEWVKKYYEDLNETLFWQEGDEVSSDYYYDVYGRNTVYLVDDDELYFDDANDCSKAEFMSFEDALLKETPAPPAASIVEFDAGKVFRNKLHTQLCSRGRIHCKTEEQARSFLSWLIRFSNTPGNGKIVWPGDDPIGSDTYFSRHGNKTCYVIQAGALGLTEVCGDGKDLEYEDVVLSYAVKKEADQDIVEFDLSKFKEDLGIHCRTEEQANTFFNWLSTLNFMWQGGAVCGPTTTFYDVHEGDTAYFIQKEIVSHISLEEVDMHTRLKYEPYEYFLKQEAPIKLSSKPVPSEKEKQTKKTTIRKEQKIMNIPSVSKVIENVKTAATTSKDAIIQAQKGTALLAAVKAGLNKGPLPAQVKELINTPYWGDFVTGIMLHTVVPTVTDSKLAKDAVEAANVVASIGLSEHFSWIQDTIKSVIEKTLPDFSKAVVEEAAKE